MHCREISGTQAEAPGRYGRGLGIPRGQRGTLVEARSTRCTTQKNLQQAIPCSRNSSGARGRKEGHLGGRGGQVDACGDDALLLLCQVAVHWVPHLQRQPSATTINIEHLKTQSFFGALGNGRGQFSHSRRMLASGRKRAGMRYRSCLQEVRAYLAAVGGLQLVGNCLPQRHPVRSLLQEPRPAHHSVLRL